MFILCFSRTLLDIRYTENRLPEPDEDMDEEDLKALDLPFDDFVKYMKNK